MAEALIRQHEEELAMAIRAKDIDRIMSLITAFRVPNESSSKSIQRNILAEVVTAG